MNRPGEGSDENGRTVITIDGSSSEDDEPDRPGDNVERRKTGPTMISFDLGENATAYCVGTCVDGRTHIDGMGIATLGKMSCARLAVRAMWDVLSRLPKASVVLVEEQPPINRKTCMLEAALSALSIAAYGAKLVVHVPPPRVAGFYGMPSGYAAKKRAAVSVAERMLADGTLGMTAGAKTVFRGVSRRHDAADAILQMTWFAAVGRAEIGGIDRGDQPWDACVRATAPKDAKAQGKRDVERRRKTSVALSALVSGPVRAKRTQKKNPVKPTRSSTKKRRLS